MAEYVATTPEELAWDHETLRQLLNLPSGAQIILEDSGWDSRVYFVDNQYVFKFPREAKVRDHYEREIAALKLVASFDTPIRFPEVVFEHPDNHYFGYRFLPGGRLQDSVKGLSQVTKERIGEELAGFLTQLHRSKLAVAEHEDDFDFQKLYKEALPLLKTICTDNELNTIEQFVLQQMPERLAQLPRDIVLCHADLGYWNILIDDANLIAIIDFGDICYTDKAIDLSETHDQQISQSLFKVYGADEELIERAQLRARALPIAEITYWSKQDVKSRFDACVAELHANFRSA